ncbi:MAG: DUF1329 domain-containing protein [Deltaproteobacteria bacterium]|nr:MAG: DUF1329 domain-containing protein [Deltaproteobacteria bacterium]
MIRSTAATMCIAASMVLAVAGPLRAQVQSGESITKANADKVKDLVSPGMFWCVQHGWPMKIVEAQPIPQRKAFTEATEKYSGQVKLTPDGLGLLNYVAGRPFPQIDTNDKFAPIKIMHNFSMQVTIDDLDLRNFDADTGPISEERPLQVERHFLIDHFRRLSYVGRLYVDPKPEIPNKEGFHYKETLHPLIEPFDLKGVGFTYYRYLDPAKQDDSWLYLPSLRRVRRLSTAQRSDALFGQDTDQDSYGGYAGQIAWMDWKLLGQKDQRLGVRRRVGEAPDVHRRGRVEAAAVRVLEARALRRQGDLRDPVQRHVRPRWPAVEGLGQQLHVSQRGVLRRLDQVRRDHAHDPVDRDGRHAAAARDQGVAPELPLPRRGGLVLAPGREGRYDGRSVHDRRTHRLRPLMHRRRA